MAAITGGSTLVASTTGQKYAQLGYNKFLLNPKPKPKESLAAVSCATLGKPRYLSDLIFSVL